MNSIQIVTVSKTPTSQIYQAFQRMFINFYRALKMFYMKTIHLLLGCLCAAFVMHTDKSLAQNDSIVKLSYEYHGSDSTLTDKTTWFLKSGKKIILGYSKKDGLIYYGCFINNRPSLIQIAISPTDTMKYQYEYNEKNDLIKYLEYYGSPKSVLLYNVDNYYTDNLLSKQVYWMTDLGQKSLYSEVKYGYINDDLKYEQTLYYQKKWDSLEFILYDNDRIVYKDVFSMKYRYIYDRKGNLLEYYTLGETWIYSYIGKLLESASEYALTSYGLSEKKSYQLYNYYPNDSIKSIEFYDGRGQLDHTIKNYFIVY